MNIRNEDIKEIVVEIPEGHKHIRTKITLQDATELVFRKHCCEYYQGLYYSQNPSSKNIGEAERQQLGEKKRAMRGWQLLEESFILPGSLC